MLFGYARISTESQNLDIQVEALELFGVPKDMIYADVDSGKKTDRKQLESLLSRLRPGDEIVFYDLTRIGRNLKHLITVMEYLAKHEIECRDLSNPAINTRSMETPAGKLIFNIFAALGQYQREESNRKVKAGLEAARARGKFGGRRPGPTQKLIQKAPLAVMMHKDPDKSLKDICEALDIAPGSVYKCFEIEGYDFRKQHKNRSNNNRTKNTKIKN